MTDVLQVARVRVRPMPSAVATQIAVPIATQPRVRTREPQVPKSWPNGSAVFRQRTGSIRHPWGVPYERQIGFLGRTLRLQGKTQAWKWRPSGYVFMGDFPSTYLAIDKLL
jgi:hypothetical protein